MTTSDVLEYQSALACDHHKPMMHAQHNHLLIAYLPNAQIRIYADTGMLPEPVPGEEQPL